MTDPEVLLGADLAAIQGDVIVDIVTQDPGPEVILGDHIAGLEDIHHPVLGIEATPGLILGHILGVEVIQGDALTQGQNTILDTQEDILVLIPEVVVILEIGGMVVQGQNVI